MFSLVKTIKLYFEDYSLFILISLIFFLTGTLFLFSCSLIYGKSIRVDTLSLQFGKVDTPPFCYIPHKLLRRPQIGLALSGGGARGFAQIGVLQVLEENNIPIDIIIGSSMGSIIGGLYAAGYSPKQIEELAKSVDWNGIMSDNPPRTSLFIGQKQERSRAILQIRFKGLKPTFPQAITPGQKLTSILTRFTLSADYPTSSNFDHLKVPFRAVACDLITGEKIIIEKGNLAEAMKASSAVPLLFTPVAQDTMLLVDGGLVNNIPVDEVRDSGVDLVIAVDTVSKLRPKNKLTAPWEIADQVTTIMQREKNLQQRHTADILIKVDLNDYKSDSFQQVPEIIEVGRRETAQHIADIKKLFQSKNLIELSNQKYLLRSLEICCDNDYSKEIASNIIHSKFKATASYLDIYSSLREIYQTGFFDNAKAECILDDSLLTINYCLTSNPILKTVILEGTTVFSDSIIQAQLQSKINTPINYSQSKADLSRIIRLYKENGFALVDIDQIRLQNDTLKMRINEGSISSIEIEGNERTSNYVILRELPLKPGDIFNTNQADEGMNNIHSTGLFENVSFEVYKNEQQVHLKIKVKEKAFNLLRLSYRYDLERKSKGMMELVDENFLGSGNQVTLHGQFGNKDQIIQFKFRADRIFKSLLTTNFDVFSLQTKNFNYLDGNHTGEYLQTESGFSFSLGRQIERLGIFSITATLSSFKLDALHGYGFPTGRWELKTIALQSIVDTQDQVPFPRTGKYYQFFYKMSSAQFLNSQVSFIKLFNALEIYYTFLKRNTIHPKLFWGTSDLTTPFIEQFRLGGEASFYGLKQNERIARHLAVGSLEYRFLFPFGFPIKVYWSVRYDIGATWKNRLEINSQDFIHGLGASLAFETPVGPISFAMGNSGKGKNVFYFSGGFNF